MEITEGFLILDQDNKPATMVFSKLEYLESFLKVRSYLFDINKARLKEQFKIAVTQGYGIYTTLISHELSHIYDDE